MGSCTLPNLVDTIVVRQNLVNTIAAMTITVSANVAATTRKCQYRVLPLLSPRANGSTNRDSCRRRHRSRDSTANASVVCCRRYHHANGSTTRHRRRQRSHDSHHHPRARRQYESIISATGVCFATQRAVSVPPMLSKPPAHGRISEGFWGAQTPPQKTSSAWIDLAAAQGAWAKKNLDSIEDRPRGTGRPTNAE